MQKFKALFKKKVTDLESGVDNSKSKKDTMIGAGDSTMVAPAEPTKWDPTVNSHDLIGSLAKELTAVADTPIPVDMGHLDNVKEEQVEGTSEYTAESHSFDNGSLDQGSQLSFDGEYDVEEDYEEEDSEEIEEKFTNTPLRFAEQVELKGYKLIEKIGEGAFSKVFCGIPDKNSDSAYLARNYKQVAVKVISKHDLDVSNKEQQAKDKRAGRDKQNNTNRMSSREQVMKEVRIHKAVAAGCPYIVGFIDFQETKHYYYLIQELLDGGEIFNEIVRLTYLSEDLSRHVIKQVALAVRHMHSLGIVHRDIKPENLLFKSIEYIPSKKRTFRKSDDPATKADEGVFIPTIGGGGIGIVKLADFGLSKQIFQKNTKTPCGTIEYTAPEVVKDEKYSMQVDMWGIGCVLYTMLCGFPPFYDEKIDVLTEKISRGEYTFLEPWWDEISPGAKHCVKKLLEVDPRKRYTIDEFLADPWLNTFDTFAKRKKKLEEEEAQQRRIMKRKRRKNVFERDPSLLYSPAAVAMRDAFDISNAVQREEEDKRFSPGPRKHNLSVLNESDLDEPSNEIVDGLDEQMFQLKLNSSTIIKRRKDDHKSPLEQVIT